jgi:hypothetical protein
MDLTEAQIVQEQTDPSSTHKQQGHVHTPPVWLGVILSVLSANG